MMNNSRTKVANFAAVATTLAYGLMRLYENGAYNAWESHGLTSFYMSMATAALVLVLIFALRNVSLAPFVIVTGISALFAIGAYITTEWDYYFLASLGLIGLISLYGKIRQLVAYLTINLLQNIIALVLLFRNAPDGFGSHMLMSFLLYILCAAYVMILFYLGNKREGAAQSGLSAFSALLGSTPNLMVIVDGMKRVRYISAPLTAFAGMDERAAIGRPLVDLFHEDSLKLMFADILDADNSYSATREIEMNGQPHYYKIIADKLSQSDDGMFIEITDMTEIVQASIEADEARKEAEAANRSKSSFLATMSHEIRTPMNSIIGASEIQLMRDDLPGDIARAFRQIHSSSHGLLGIINDILDLSKIETGKLEISPVEYDVASLINDAVQLNIVRVGSKPVVFSLELEDNLPARLIGDEMRIKQVLNNVLSNAFKYTDEGSVKLKIASKSTDGGTELIFTVTDTGQGMKPEDLARLYEEYARFNSDSNRTTEGTGLGMTITRRLVDMMQGTIDVSSEYGKGSVFTITIVQQPSGDKSVIEREHAEKLCDFTYTINREIQSINITREFMPYGSVLIVDDVDTNLYVAKGLLSPYGLHIETAASGFEALDIIAGAGRFDIVFMDHMMPKLDGVETTLKLRESGYDGTIVALTANAIAGNDKFFRENGFDDFISKPIDMRQMNMVLNRFIRDKQPPAVIEQARASHRAQIGGKETPSGAPAGDLMEIFKRDARKAVQTLLQTSQNGDFKLFATTAHAMKSAALNVDEPQISQMAGWLERAGNERDAQYIALNTQAFVDALNALAQEPSAETGGDFEEDLNLLREEMAKIRAACEDFDGGAARAALKRLGQSRWKPDTARALDDISEMILCSDFDEAAQIAGRFS